jgi:uncharacterized membrane protein
MVERELAAIEDDPAYQSALAKVEELQQPLLNRLSDGIRDTLREFLPNVKQVRVEIPKEARYRALRRACGSLLMTEPQLIWLERVMACRAWPR